MQWNWHRRSRTGPNDARCQGCRAAVLDPPREGRDRSSDYPLFLLTIPRRQDARTQTRTLAVLNHCRRQDSSIRRAAFSTPRTEHFSAKAGAALNCPQLSAPSPGHIHTQTWPPDLLNHSRRTAAGIRRAALSTQQSSTPARSPRMQAPRATAAAVPRGVLSGPTAAAAAMIPWRCYPHTPQLDSIVARGDVPPQHHCFVSAALDAAARRRRRRRRRATK